MTNFIGYHGTRLQDAENIIKKRFRIKQERVGWLGTGIYFFQDNEEMARNFALQNFNNIGVIKCEIDVKDEQVFDVTDPLGKSSKKFHAFRKEMIENTIKHKFDIEVKDKNELDGKVFNLICIKYRYKLVRNNTYTFQQEDKVNSYRLNSRVANGIELCVRENTCIIKKEIV